jgi:REP element-mobilizing transposase RayT
MRHPGWDYSSSAGYFVTICTHEREHVFGEILNGKMVLNKIGLIVLDNWERLPDRFQNLETDAFVIMPNHVHCVLRLTDFGRGESCIRPSEGDCPHGTLEGTLGRIIQTFKSITTVEYIRWQRQHNQNEVVPKLWQRNYHDHVIRSQESLEHFQIYIQNNPANWSEDEYKGK